MNKLKNYVEYVSDRISVKDLDETNYIGVDNLVPNRGGICTAEYVPEDGYVTKFIVGDILLGNIRPYFKKIWLAEFEGGASPDVLVLRPFHNNDSKFVYAVMSQDSFFDYDMAGSKGSKMPRGDKTHILEYPVIEVKNRDEIGKLINNIDRKIKINNRINDNLSKIAQSFFIQMFAKKTIYSTNTLSDVSIKITDGEHGTVINDEQGKYYLLSCKNIKNGCLSISSDDRRINETTFSKLRSRTKLSKGDVLISSVGTIGELYLLMNEPVNYEFQRSVAIVKPNPQLISSYYLFESLLFQKKRLINAAHGAVQQCLFISDFEKIPMYIPTSVELSIYNNQVEPLFYRISINEKENNALSNLRRWLLPMLMNGQATISD